MPIVRHAGIEIECATPAEAVEVARALGAGAVKANNPPAPKDEPPSAPKMERVRIKRPTRKRLKVRAPRGTGLERCVDVLRVLLNAGPGGVTTETLVLTLGLPEGRSLSGLPAVAAPVLADAGLEVEDVFERERRRQGSLWRAGPMADQALAVLRRAAQRKTGGGRTDATT